MKRTLCDLCGNPASPEPSCKPIEVELGQENCYGRRHKVYFRLDRQGLDLCTDCLLLIQDASTNAQSPAVEKLKAMPLRGPEPSSPTTLSLYIGN